MRDTLFPLLFLISFLTVGSSQPVPDSDEYDKNRLVWNGAIFKSWLMDEHVGFNKIGSKVTPVFSDQHKMGIGINANFIHKPIEWLGVGFHLGVGVDINSIPVPLVLFGGSLTLGKQDRFVINAGWADGKRRIIPESLRNELITLSYSEIPEIYPQTELNTGFYVGLGFKIF